MSAPLYGLMAEFASADVLLRAAQRARADGYKHLEAYSPVPIAGLSEAVGMRFNGIPLLVLLGAGLTAAGIYLLQVITSVYGYPFNIGGRPDFSWPAFVLPALELTFLGAAVAGVIGMLFLNRLPRYYHPAFNAPNFERASRDRFFLCIAKDDPQFELDKTRQFMETLRPAAISEVSD
jgi:hypothetical protein